jgi:hypothetical protein
MYGLRQIILLNLFVNNLTKDVKVRKLPNL